MKNATCSSLIAAAFCIAGGVAQGDGAETIVEGAREIPVIEETDVLVVGGTFGGVTAAVAAKQAGADVFLVSPRWQLGEEMSTPRRLWSDPSAEGASDDGVADVFPPERRIPYTYAYSRDPAASHSDNNSLLRLTDGDWQDSTSQSVQFDGDCTITATLRANAGALQSLTLWSFHREGSGGFVTGTLVVKGSSDGASYQNVEGALTTEQVKVPGRADPIDVITFTPSAPTEYTRLQIECPLKGGYSRQLLGELAIRTVYGDVEPATPLSIAKSLDARLMGANIPFLTGATVTDVLRDGNGELAGVVIANRNGRQAIRAKKIVDATEWGAVARAAGCAFVSEQAQTVFSRTIVCATNALAALPEGYSLVADFKSPKAEVKLDPTSLLGVGAVTPFGSRAYRIERTFAFDRLDYAALMEIERQFRDDTWVPSTVEASERVAFTPPDRIAGQASFRDAWTDANAVPLAAFAPSGCSHLWVLGPCADLSRADAARIAGPGVASRLGARIGAAAAEAATARSLAGTLSMGTAQTVGTTTVRERLTRPLNVGNVTEGAVTSVGAALPGLTNVDVVVVGAGTAGAPAAIAAGAEGRRVLVTDVIYTMGGSAVDNRIGTYYHGNPVGFAAAISNGAKSYGWAFYAAKSEWLRHACSTNGVAAWFGTFAEGVVTEGVDAEGRAQVRGIVVALPDGTRGVVRANVVVDATGNADLTAAAGGETTYLSAYEFAMQGAGSSNKQIGKSYLNTDVGFLNDTDAGDLAFFALRSRLGLDLSFSQPSFPGTGTRERRRIVGDYTVTELDVLCGRTYSDTIMHGKSNFDMHGYTTSDVLFFLKQYESDEFEADLPYRALLPAGLDGLYATGLGISATRDAMPVLRMQPDVHNQGWAVGLAAAAASAEGATVRTIDVRVLQSRLVEQSILKSRVTTDVDSSVTEQQLDDAVETMSSNFSKLQYILASDPTVALPKLRTAYAAATTDTRKVALSCALSLLGDNAGVPFLLSWVASRPWDTGLNFTGMGCYGRQTSDLDAIIYALAKSHDPRVVPYLSTLVGGLIDPDGHFRSLSHVRTVVRAVQEMPVANFAPTFIETLAYKPVLTNQCMTAPTPVSYSSDSTNNNERTQAITGLLFGSMLFRLNDSDGAGRTILERYAADSRAVYAEYANLVLAGAPYTTLDTGYGKWQSNAASDAWSNPAAWEGGAVPSGMAPEVVFDNGGTGAQTVSLDGEEKSIGSITFADGASRTFTNGSLSFTGDDSFISVASGETTLDVPLGAFALALRGDGTLTLRDAVDVPGMFSIEQGTLKLDNGAALRAIDTDSTFTVTDGPLWVTHLGCSGTDPEWLVQRPYVCILNAAGKRMMSVQLTPSVPGFARNDFHYLRLPEPLMLENGATYALQVVDRAASPLPGFAASLLATANDPVCRLGTINNDAALSLATPIVTVAAISGTGTVATASSDPALLEIRSPNAEKASELTGTVAGDAPLGLLKTGLAPLTLGGTNSYDSIFFQYGVTRVDDLAALGETTPLVFGGKSMTPRGTLLVAQPEAEISNPILAYKMSGYNYISNGLAVASGCTLTLKDTEVLTPDIVCNDGGVDCGTLCLVAGYAEEPTTLNVHDVTFDYVDLLMQVDGVRNGAKGANAINVSDIAAPKGLRKFSVVNSVSNSVGGTVTLTGGDLKVGWLDMQGTYPTFRMTDGAKIVADNVRLPNNNTTHHSNAEFIMEQGAHLVAPQIPNSSYFSTNTTFVFDGATLQLKNDNSGDYLALNCTNPPCQILEGGLTFNLQGYDDGAPYSLRIKHPMTSPDPSVPGPLCVRDGNHCKLSAEMSFNGPIFVENAQLWFDFTVGDAMGLQTMLTRDVELALGTNGVLKLESSASGKSQHFAAISNAVPDAAATIEVANGCEISTDTLLGAGGYAVRGTGTFAVKVLPDNAALLPPRISADGATLKICAPSVLIPPTLVTEGSFETVPLLNSEPEAFAQGSRDKRGNSGAPWLKSNFKAWTFDANDYVGVTRNGGYFVNNVANGEQCAFIRNASGFLHHTFTAAETADYTLVFDLKPRNYGGTMYNANCVVKLDDVILTTVPAEKKDEWQAIEVPLGRLMAGTTHKLSFGSNGSAYDGLIDNVRLGCELSGAKALAAAGEVGCEITLTNGAKLNLDFDGVLSVSKLFIDGLAKYGTLNAQTLPGVIIGTGSLRSVATATLLIFR